MSYKTILVQGGAAPEAVQRVKAAMSVGERFGARLIGVGAEAWAPYVEPDFGFAGPGAVQVLRDALDANLAKAATAFSSLCAGYGQPHAWASSVAYPAEFMSELARGADLIVVGRRGKAEGDTTHADPGELLMGAGSPVLVVPQGVETVECGTVLIAWKDTREARRALTDSIPFLQQAAKVLLFQVRAEDTADESRVQDILDRLGRHGVQASSVVRAGTELSAGDEIVQAAEAHHVDLVVAGAYGHSRLREWVFGGVTRTLLAHSPKPVLFSR